MYDIIPIIENDKTIGITSTKYGDIYCLKPNRIVVGGNALFHGLPRNAHKIKRIRECCEFSIYTRILADCGPKITNFSEHSFLLRHKSEAGKKYRAKIFAAKARALYKTNGLLAKSLTVADLDSVKLTRRFNDRKDLIYKLATTNIRFKQLIETFPYLGYRLTTEKSKEVGEYIHQMILDGKKLKHIVNHLSIPMALRKIKPQAVHFSGLTRLIMRFPDIENLINAYLPKTTMEQYRLFAALTNVTHIGNFENFEKLAIWMFKSFDKKTPLATSCSDLRILIDYIRARELYGVRQFHENMSLATVREASDLWHRRIGDLRVAYTGLDPATVFGDPWLPGDISNGIKIEPITTLKDLIDEGHKMRHCVSSYGRKIVNGDSYIYSVSKDNEKVATLELVKAISASDLYEGIIHKADENKLAIAQLRGPCNEKVSDEIYKAVNDWIKQYELNHTPYTDLRLFSAENHRQAMVPEIQEMQGW